MTMLKIDKGAHVKIEVIGSGGCKLYIDGHEIPGVISVDTDDLVKRDHLCKLSIDLAIASFEIVGASKPE